MNECVECRAPVGRGVWRCAGCRGQYLQERLDADRAEQAVRPPVLGRVVTEQAEQPEQPSADAVEWRALGVLSLALGVVFAVVGIATGNGDPWGMVALPAIVLGLITVFWRVALFLAGTAAILAVLVAAISNPLTALAVLGLGPLGLGAIGALANKLFG